MIIKTDSFLNLIVACNHLESTYRTFCPTLIEGIENYYPLDQMDNEEISSIEDIAFRSKPPLSSIKSFLFPDSEIYIKYSRNGNKIDLEDLENITPQIILGVKPCDIKSIELIDKVFLAEPVDSLYQEKRDKTLTIASVCTQLDKNCSCEAFDICPTGPKSDISMTKDESSSIYLKSNSPKGESFLKELLSIDSFIRCESFPAPEINHQGKKLSSEKVKERMDEYFNSTVWENLAMLCIGCGTCTYYCPTCHCYDIKDFNRNDKGVRYRTWDSCMFSNFTNMAGGHNPRPSKKDRIQNRFFHKLNYFVKKQGDLACVGCGRCAELCPVGISINTVLKKIGGELYET